MLTLMQLYDLGQNIHTDIFSGITLPANSPLDRQTLINSIMERCGLNIPLYADPYVMTSAINLWSAKNQYTFEHVGKILTSSYSPIENTEKFEDITVDHSRDMTDNTTGTNNKNESFNATVENGSHSYAAEAHTGSDVSENTTSAYNAGTYQPDTQNTLTHGETVNTSEQMESNSINRSSKNTAGNLKNDKKVNENEKTRTVNHTHGNIGVMSNQTMLTEEYELLGKFNPYSFLAGLFENDLTLYIY